MSKIAFRVACVAGAILFSPALTAALATEQVYHPVSPTFGGNPNNGTFLLSTAQAQGEGVKSGNQGPDLTPLATALGSLGNGNGNGNGSAGNGNGGGTTPSSMLLLAVPTAVSNRMP